MYQDRQLGRGRRSQQARRPKEIDTLIRTKAPQMLSEAVTQLGGTLGHPRDSRPLEWLSAGFSRPDTLGQDSIAETPGCVKRICQTESVDYFTPKFSGQDEPAHVCRQNLGPNRTYALYTDISGNITIYTLLGDL